MQGCWEDEMRPSSWLGAGHASCLLLFSRKYRPKKQHKQSQNDARVSGALGPVPRVLAAAGWPVPRTRLWHCRCPRFNTETGLFPPTPCPSLSAAGGLSASWLLYPSPGVVELPLSPSVLVLAPEHSLDRQVHARSL